MNKKLPNVYVNKIEKKLNNNEKVFTTTKEEKNIKENSKKNNIEKNINQKINEIFKSSKYIYKADVIIITETEELNKRIIGKNKNYLITIENELIPIEKIIDIKFKE